MNILFKIFPQKSHLNATFPLARALRERGHKVIYAGVEPLRRHVEAQGHAYHVERSDVYPYIEDKRNAPKLTLSRALLMWWKNRRRSESTRARYARGDTFDALIKATAPDLILLDSPYTFFGLAVYKHRIPFGTLESMMNLDRAPGCPPMDTDHVPREGRLGRLICGLHWRRYFVKRWLLGAVGFRADFDRKFVVGSAKKFGIDPGVISFDRYFHLGLRNVPEFILSPRLLDFPRVASKNQVYVGPAVEINRVESSSDYRFCARFERILSEREQGRPLVYCSLGTAGWRYKGAERFLRNVVVAARGSPWNLILAIGTELDPSHFESLPENVAVFQVVPQLEILKKADLMVTHGGMNSITESVMLGVPLLVYPGTRQIDQAGNAARVVYHGLGLKGRMVSETERDLRGKIQRLLADRGFRSRVEAVSLLMRNHTDPAGSAGRLLACFPELSTKTTTNRKKEEERYDAEMNVQVSAQP